MSTQDNPPAFPHDARDIGKTPSNGMTLRDYFAGQWLAGLGADPATADSHSDDIARGCYMIADAMLAARKESNE